MSKKVSSILISVMFLLLGIVIIMYRSGLESKLKLVIGIGIIILGVVRVLTAIFKSSEDKVMLGDIIVGIILVAFGIVILVIHMALTYVIGAFFIVEGIRRIIYCFSRFGKNIGWVISFIFAIAILGAGVYFLILKGGDITPFLVIFIGIVLAVMGVQGIISVFSAGKKSEKAKAAK